MSNPYIYCVVYRTGGTCNFKWHRIEGMTQEEARKAQEEIQRGGRVCHVETSQRSMAIGLPETYAP
jgi:hypothetical protein